MAVSHIGNPIFCSRFDEFDEAIEEAIEEDIKEAEGGGKATKSSSLWNLQSGSTLELALGWSGQGRIKRRRILLLVNCLRYSS